jgi:uncharacterized protein
MFYRTILNHLDAWYRKEHRKPLILRGARQTGKTSVVQIFAASFKQFLYLNLELTEDRKLFEQNLPFDRLLEALFFHKDLSFQKSSTLLFIDEIQNSPEAIVSLRYFYEKSPEIPVIAAGSLLEVYMDKFDISFPVGRVEYLHIYPMSFYEYLLAKGEERAVEAYMEIPSPDYAADKLFALFHEYAQIGGMPEVVSHYLQYRDLSALKRIFSALRLSYEDDAGKYAKTSNQYEVIRHVIDSAPFFAGNRITFHGFGNSSYRSREAGEAFSLLQRAMILFLLYPTTDYKRPLLPNKRKSPRLQFLDIGMVNNSLNIVDDYFSIESLTDYYRGSLIEQICGQELIALNPFDNKPPLFWVREKQGSTAELDYLLEAAGETIPLEIKAGKTGRLRSLMQFIDESPVELAIRLYRGPCSKTEEKTIKGKPFTLINLPYFLIARAKEYILK